MAWGSEVGMDRLTVHPPAGSPSVAVGSAHAPDARAATPLQPRDVADVREIVRDAIDRKKPLRIVGRGTWLDAGRPVADAQPVSLEGLSGIVDYTPGDLTLTARAGTTLAEIATATAPHSQWLALAPWGGDAGSLGATAATATAGPMSGALGAPRDTIIGVEAVTGGGDVVRGGGRVVKNVAGFDLTRLMVGAWGTLGLLTEVSVRLRGLPERDVTVAFPAPNAGSPLTEFLTRVRSVAAIPLALEIVSGALAARLGLAAQPMILARLAGNAEAVAAQREAFAALADVHDVTYDVWSALRVADGSDSSTVRFSSAGARFADVWSLAERCAIAAGGHAHGSLLRSIARVVLPHHDGAHPDSAVAALRAPGPYVRIFERLPSAVWPSLAPTAVADRLSRGVRAAFDPYWLLNPGILGEERP
jgi:glycolate oxidase FAD binding subunit